MGIDFIEKTKAGFRRRESQELRKLSEKGLFASQTPSRRTFRGHAAVELTGLTPGTVCILHQTDDCPAIYDRNNRIIATAPRLTPGTARQTHEAVGRPVKMVGSAHRVSSVRS